MDLRLWLQAPWSGGGGASSSSPTISVQSEASPQRVHFDDAAETWVQALLGVASPYVGKQAPSPVIKCRTVYILLMLVGAGVSCLTVSVLTIVKLVVNAQTAATLAAASRWGDVAGCCAWASIGVLVTASAFLLTCWCPQAIGSGIPEVKVEIRGLRLQNFFVQKVMWAKAVGLALGQGAGLPIGKEGPFVHFAACVSSLLLRTSLSNSQANRLRSTMLTASVAVGVGASFSVPIAGVLFALEAMPDAAWHNTTYWSCLAAALTGSVTSRILNSAINDGAMTDMLDGPLLPPVVSRDLSSGLGPDLDPGSRSWLLALSVLLGAFCGLLGPFFTKLQQVCARHMNRWRLGKHAPPPGSFEWHLEADGSEHAAVLPKESEEHLGVSYNEVERVSVLHMRKDTGYAQPLLEKGDKERLTPRQRGLLLCIGVAALNSTLAYMVPVLRDLQAPLLAQLFTSEPIDFSAATKALSPPMESWKGVAPLLGLAIAIAVKFLATTLALSLPLPTGCIAPVYVLGALLGRFFGQLVQDAGALLGGGGLVWSVAKVLPAHFALVGAAAFSAAVCRSFSMAVAIYELAPLAAMELPIATGTMVAILVANNYGPSIFDAILASKKLPAPLQFRTFRFSMMPVGQVMRQEVPTVKQHSTLDDLTSSLAKYPRARFFAVVADDGKLVGALTKTRFLAVQAALAESPEAEGRPASVDFSDGAGLPGMPSMDVKPLTVPAKLHLQDLAVLFIMHKCDVAFVTEPDGCLTGMVQASDIQQLQS